MFNITTLTTREMQAKTTMIHYMPTRTAKMKNFHSAKGSVFFKKATDWKKYLQIICMTKTNDQYLEYTNRTLKIQ